MSKILTPKEAIKEAKRIKKELKTIVIAGGCFDILHVGHVKFLENAKKQGNYLFVLLESDESVKKRKGPKRPINSQRNRAKILSALGLVDYVILGKYMTKDWEYDKLMIQIMPDVIATTYKDPYAYHKERQARKIGAKVRYVIKRIGKLSSSSLATSL